ncbi:MAG: hypothetical protein R3D67_07675 [Hyphomicrobiaceae bacterium]
MVVPPLVSLVAPVVAVMVEVPAAVGVPETGQEIVAAAARDATGVAGVHAPTVNPAGSPETAQVAPSALPGPLFVHTTVPEYAVPTAPGLGKPLRLGTMSEPLTVSDAVVELFAVFGSVVELVVPVSVTVPAAVGVPEIVQLMELPTATETGGTGVHENVRPAGNPDTAQVALVAATVPPLVQMKV